MQDFDEQTANRGAAGRPLSFGEPLAEASTAHSPWLTIDRSRERLEARLRGTLIAAVVVGAATAVLQLTGIGHGAPPPSQAPKAQVAGQQAPPQGEPAPPADQPGPTTGAPDTAAPAPTAASGTAVAGGATARAGTSPVPTGSPRATAAGAVGTAAATPRAGGTVSSTASPRAAGAASPSATARAGGAATPASSGLLAAPPATPNATTAARTGTTSVSILTPLVGTPGPDGLRSHVVRAGDTLFAIANGNNTTVEALVSANKLPASDTILSIGQKLVLP